MKENVSKKACDGANDNRKRHVLLCVLSDLKIPREEGPTSYAYMVKGFDASACTSYEGWHTNEAPFKLLFDLALGEGYPFDKVIYLCSDLCGKKEVRIRRPDDTFWEGTAEEYFRHVVAEHMDGRGLSEHREKGFFVAIPYEPELPEKMLAEVIGELGNNVLVDVDASGGLRDAQILLYQVINFLKAGSREDNIVLGKVVYANLGAGELANQERTYALSELVDAVDAFTRYGKADMLVDWFSGERSSEEVRRLCESLRDFSADLSLCRMGGIDDTVKEIHERFDRLEDAAKADGASTWVVLMASLVPTMRAGFVQPLLSAGERDEAAQTIEIIRWCVERQYLQQALALIREKVPVMLVQLGYLRQGEEAPALGSKSWVNCVVQLSDNIMKPGHGIFALDEERLKSGARELKSSLMESPERGSLKGGDLKKIANHMVRIWHPADVVNNEIVFVTEERQSGLRAVLVWYHYLQKVRNDVMHANVGEDTGKWSRDRLARGCELTLSCDALPDFGCRYDKATKTLDVARCLTEDVELCLKALEGEIHFELK